MKYTNQYVNQLLEQEINFSNEIAFSFHYPDNITHLLYIIIPAFLLKYGFQYKSLIEKCFSSVPIIIDDQQDQVYQAYYFSKPVLEENNYKILKGIVLKNYQNIGLMQLVDNLVHEFNHAVNSLQNEIFINQNIKLRTGLVYSYFDKKNLTLLKKGEEIMIEEIVNTKQTEDIIHIIRDLSNYHIENTTVVNTLYSINHTIDQNYHSNSYLLESLVCQQLLKNKTFFSTIEVLRFNGQLDDIHHFFDSIVGKKDSLLQLSRYLSKSIEIQNELLHIKWFKNSKINKLREVNQKALEIVQKFDQNTVYK